VSATEASCHLTSIEDASPARVLNGNMYALVDPAFAFDGSRPVASATAARRLLISYGGSDPTGETFTALEAVRAWKAESYAFGRIGPIDVVVGPANGAAASIAREAAGIPDVSVH